MMIALISDLKDLPYIKAKMILEIGKREIYLVFKRILDLLGSALSIIIILPLWIILATVIWVFLGWPIFFKQERPGRNAKSFVMIKFRTMTNECDTDGNLLADQLRTKKIGRFLRRTSLDELPELFNVFKGEMSFIGPRPLLVKYLPYFTDYERARHSVRPGITGLAQVNGRHMLSWNKRLKLDVQYTQKVSLLLDIKIAFLTISSVIRQIGVLDVSSETIPDFDVYRVKQLDTPNSDNEKDD